MKLTKQQSKLHSQALEICQQEVLGCDEKIFVLENYHEGATNVNSNAGAFFTPLSLGRDFSMECMETKSIVDLCAGIGHLSWNIMRNAELQYKEADITCIEINPEYYEIGKKILPKATWILGDVTDFDLWMDLCPNGVDMNRFNLAISNPPFGKIKTGANSFPLKYKGAEFDLKVVEIATNIAQTATFLLPQMSTPFKYSGQHAERNGYEAKSGRSSKYDKFKKQTGIEFTFNVGINAMSDQWKGVSPTTEIVNWEGIHADDYEDKIETKVNNNQLNLF